MRWVLFDGSAAAVLVNQHWLSFVAQRYATAKLWESRNGG
jgi:hypothetical protein